MTVKYIPDGHRTITPYITASDPGQVIDFAQRVFGARIDHRMTGPDGRVWHADLVIGDSHLMIGWARPPQTPMPAMLYLYVPDCDAVYNRALEAGATSVMAVADMFYGDRHGGVRDPFGNEWWIATHVEDVSEEELERRSKAHAEKAAHA